MRREKNSAGAWVCPASADTIDKSKIGFAGRLLWVIAICLFASLAHAETYYVNPNGSDSNPGTAAAPFRTINRALGFIGTAPGAGAGQVVEVAAGTYNESLMFDLPSGISWDQPFTLRARAGDVVTIKGDNSLNVFIAGGIDYYSVIDGFVFDGANTWQAQVIIGSCCDPQPRLVRFQNNEFINNRYGTFLIGGDYNEFVNNKVHGGFEEYTGCGQVHCFGYAFYVIGSNNLFSGNEIYDVASWVFHIYDNEQRDGGPHDNIVQNNTIHDFGFGDRRANGILLSSGPRNHANNNVVYNGSSGISIWRACHGCEISNNTVSNMNSCLEVADSDNAVVNNNNLSNCSGSYISIQPNLSGLTLSNILCDRAAANCLVR